MLPERRIRALSFCGFSGRMQPQSNCSGIGRYPALSPFSRFSGWRPRH
jgi:Transposase DDE domain